MASRSEALKRGGAAEGGQVPQVPPKEVPRQLHQGKRLVLLDPEKPEELQRMKSETWQEMEWPRLGSMDLQGSMFFLGGPECLEFSSSFGLDNFGKWAKFKVNRGKTTMMKRFADSLQMICGSKLSVILDGAVLGLLTSHLDPDPA